MFNRQSKSNSEQCFFAHTGTLGFWDPVIIMCNFCGICAIFVTYGNFADKIFPKTLKIKAKINKRPVKT